MTVQLRGITWDHTRGFTAVVAAAQRYHENHGTIDVRWEKRSLQAFADFSLERLIDRYDLLVIDYPWVGEAARKGWLVALDTCLSPDVLAELRRQSVGDSYDSYHYGGHQWAVPIDAAAPVASWRPDLLERHGASPPQLWTELLELAKGGCVILAAKPIDLLMDFYMLVAKMDPAWGQNGRLAREDVIGTALERLRELVSLCPPEVLHFNPVDVYEAMTGTDLYAYCPFAYGYVNYAVAGYARVPLAFGDIVQWNSTKLASILGGTGLAVSARSPHREDAVRLAEFVSCPKTQMGIYTWAGGQPAVKAVWEDDQWNQITGGYYRKTRPVLDRALVRPRHAGYPNFQDVAGSLVHGYVAHGGQVKEVVRKVNQRYCEASEALS